MQSIHSVKTENTTTSYQEVEHEYKACELRALVSSTLLGLDQKILHFPSIDESLIERKRASFHRASVEYEIHTGVVIESPVQGPDFREELKQMKLSILNALRFCPPPQPSGIEWTNVRAEPNQKNFEYADMLSKIFSKNLVGVVVYGSAVFSEAPGDYDNFIIVNDLEEAYRQAESFKLTFKDRSVHLNFIPADLADSLLTIATIPSVRFPWLKVISGEVALPELPDSIVYLQGRARSFDLIHRRTQMLSNGIDGLTNSLVQMPTKEGESIFKTIAYLPSVMVEWSRMFIEDPARRPLAKREILQNLELDGFTLPLYSQEPQKLKIELLKSLELVNSVLKRAEFLPLPNISC